MILITGATGTNGRELINQLTQAGHQVRAMVRSRAKAEQLSGPNVELFEGDFDNPASLSAAFKGASSAFFLSAFARDYKDWFGNFQTPALENGTPHIVKFSAYGADPESESAILRLHGETDAMLRQSRLPWTILQPNSFYQNMLYSLSSIQKQGAFYLPLGIARQSCVDVSDIGAVAVKALTEAGHAGKTYVLTGPEALTYEEMASKLSTAAGRSIRYVSITPAAAREALLKLGRPAWDVDVLIELYSVFAAGKASEVTRTMQELLHRPPRTFDEYARDFALLLNSQRA